MSGRMEVDGRFYRMRRGKLVEIPAAWVGKIPTGSTKRKRLSQLPHKLARAVKHTAKGGIRYVDGRYQMIDAEA